MQRAALKPLALISRLRRRRRAVMCRLKKLISFQTQWRGAAIRVQIKIVAGKTLLASLRPVNRLNPALARRRAVLPSRDKLLSRDNRRNPRLLNSQHPEQDRFQEGRLSLHPVKRLSPALDRLRAARRSRDRLLSRGKLAKLRLVNRQRLEQECRQPLLVSPRPLHSNRWPGPRSRSL